MQLNTQHTSDGYLDLETELAQLENDNFGRKKSLTPPVQWNRETETRTLELKD